MEGQAKQLSDNLDEIAAKTDDAELKGVLEQMSTTWAKFDLDGDEASIDKSVKLMQEQPAKLAKACS